MKLPLRQLRRHLEQGLAGCYLIAADEPLLVAEAGDAVRAAARGQGFEERNVFTAERGFRWDALESQADNLSLFASRRIVEVRMSAPRPGDAGARVLRSLAEENDPDRLVLITINARLDASASRSVWLRTIEKHGVLVDIWPVDRAQLPQWLADRAAGLGLRLSRDAAVMIAERVEGNLLAADQELQKLSILAPDAQIDEATVVDCVAASARYDVFRLSDAVLAGDARRAIQVLEGLRTEGTHPTLISWAVIRELGLVARLHGAQARGESLDSTLGRLHVWRKRQPLLKRAAGRIAPDQLRELLHQARNVDRQIKGALAGPPWPALTGLVLAAVEPRSRWLTG